MHMLLSGEHRIILFTRSGSEDEAVRYVHFYELNTEYTILKYNTDVSILREELYTDDCSSCSGQEVESYYAIRS